MIIPPTDFFYVVQASGEAAEVVAATLSEGSVNDITEVVLISDDFTDDIQATHGLDQTLENVKKNLLDQDLTEETDHNPLYKPSTQDELDAVLDAEPRSENYRFIGMNNNPFIMKATRICSGDHDVLLGHVSCKPFELPSYGDIMAARANVRIN